MKPHANIPMTQEQHQALIGSMLGDGHLPLNGGAKNARLMIGRTYSDVEYLKYEASIFSNYLAPSFQFCLIKEHKSLDKRTNTLKHECSFNTSNYECFTEYHNKWYKDKIKVIPSDLVLSAQSVAHWLADDAHITYNKLPYRFIVEISTHSFTKKEVEFLASLLHNRYNEEFLVRKKNRKGKEYFIIRAYDSACRALFLDIDPYFKMKRKRIWDLPESRFWNDIPERQRSVIKEFALKKEMAKQSILDGKDFKLMDLATKLGYVYDGKVDHKSINKLLKPYLDDGLISKELDKLNNNTCTILINKEMIK